MRTIGTLDMTTSGRRHDVLTTMTIALRTYPRVDPCETCAQPAGSPACYRCTFGEDRDGEPQWRCKV